MLRFKIILYFKKCTRTCTHENVLGIMSATLTLFGLVVSCSLPLPGMVLTFRTVSTTMDVTPQSPLSSSMNKMDRAPFDTPTSLCDLLLICVTNMCMYVCVCDCVCVYVCVCVCMYVCMYIHIHTCDIMHV